MNLRDIWYIDKVLQNISKKIPVSISRRTCCSKLSSIATSNNLRSVLDAAKQDVTSRVLVYNEHNNLGLVPESQAMHRSHFERARSARQPWQAQAQAKPQCPWELVQQWQQWLSFHIPLHWFETGKNHDIHCTCGECLTQVDILKFFSTCIRYFLDILGHSWIIHHSQA